MNDRKQKRITVLLISNSHKFSQNLSQFDLQALPSRLTQIVFPRAFHGFTCFPALSVQVTDMISRPGYTFLRDLHGLGVFPRMLFCTWQMLNFSASEFW